MSRTLFTSESVTEGHPDKVCDQISDAILDAILEKDPNARVACETAVTTGLILVIGEISTNCYVDIPRVARRTVKDIGYTRAKYGFDGSTCSVLVSVDEQSPDIAQGVNLSYEFREGIDNDGEIEKRGAGDQGMMFGYATNETPEYMPLTISLAHRLTRRLAEVRKKRILPFLRPDGKSQVTVEYENGRPRRVDNVVIAAQHDPRISYGDLRAAIEKEVIRAVIPEEYLETAPRLLINPTGKFVIGGPLGDAGLTGRKIIVDTYGGMARHGGGAFSGKDPTKVDRSAAYAARYVAKNLVAAGLADRCEIQLAYAIGTAHPVSIMVELFGTGNVSQETAEKLVREHFDLRPEAIIRELDLRRPIYQKTAAYGHFGRTDEDFTWERLDKAEILRRAL